VRIAKALLIGGLFLLWGVLYTPVAVAHAAYWLQGHGWENRYGLFVPVLSLFLLVRHLQGWKHVGKEEAPRPWERGVGLVLLVIASLVHLAGVRTEIGSVSGVSAVLSFLGLIMICGGLEVTRWCVFPVALLLLFIPPPGVVTNQIGTVLRLLSARMATLVAVLLLGLPIRLEGTHIYSNAFDFDVAPPCSGINSMVALSSLGILVAYLSVGSTWKKFQFVLLLPLLAGAVNVARLVLTICLAQAFGLEVATGPLHEPLSLLLFVGAMAMALGILRWLGLQMPGAKPLSDMAECELAPTETVGKKWAAVAQALSGRVSMAWGGVALSVLVLVQGAVWASEREQARLVEQVQMEGLPWTLGRWRGEALTYSPQTHPLLHFDQLLYRRYTSAEGEILLTVVYDSHRSETYRSYRYLVETAGWKSIAGAPASPGFPVASFIQNRSRERRLVWVWYVTPTSVGDAGLFDHNWQTARNGLWLNRTDRMMVRCEVALDPLSEKRAAALLSDFATTLAPALHAIFR